VTGKVLQKFSAAVKILSSQNQPMWECVYSAYINHLNGIQADELPRKLQLLYDSVKLRLIGVIPDGNISNDEAGYIAADILYLADQLQSRLSIEPGQESPKNHAQIYQKQHAL
jgi:hypothetical protein